MSDTLLLTEKGLDLVGRYLAPEELRTVKQRRREVLSLSVGPFPAQEDLSLLDRYLTAFAQSYGPMLNVLLTRLDSSARAALARESAELLLGDIGSNGWKVGRENQEALEEVIQDYGR